MVHKPKCSNPECCEFIAIYRNIQRASVTYSSQKNSEVLFGSLVFDSKHL